MAFSYGNYATPGAQAYTGSGNVYNGNTPNDQNNFTPDQIKNWFAANPNASPQQIADTAAQYHMTPGGVAQAISIGTGANYDPGAVRGWLGANGGQSSGGTGGIGGDGVITGSNGYSPGYAGGSGSSNLGFGGGYGNQTSGGTSVPTAPGPAGGQVNPYLADMAGAITGQMNDNWTRNLEPSIRSGAMAAGGFGGSRQGVVEANGLNDMNRSLGQNLTNMYGNAWQNAQQNNLQQQGLNNNYDLGLKANNLGFANLDSNNAQFGANLNLNTLDAQNRWANNGVAAANAMQNTPIGYQNQFFTNANNIAGQGGSQTNTTQMPGNPYLGAIGGAQFVNSLIK